MLAEGVAEGRKTFGNTMKYILMGLSSNFGNMFSVLGAVLFLPFLPMLPLQILLNNFLYDLSQLTLPTDHVDDEYIRSPKHWDLGTIRRFMLSVGPISSLFDFACFVLLYRLFPHTPAAFQTGWFIMSLATQALVIHVIRTRHIPFIQSLASLPVFITTLGIVVVGWSIPYTRLGTFFGFVTLPPLVLLSVAGLVVLYLAATELGKRVYYRTVGS